MKMKRLTAGLLALTLLCGCSAAADPDDMAYLTADIKRDSEIVTVDGQGITAEAYLFWMVSAISTQKYLGSLADDSAWEETLEMGEEEGPTAEVLKKDALETAKLYRVIETKATQAGVTLTEEQEEEINDQIQQIAEQLGGEEALQSWLEARCITKEGFLALNRVYYLNANLKEKLEADGELTVTDEDVEAFISEQSIYGAKHILFKTVDTDGEPALREDGSYGYPLLDEETVAAKKAQAQQVLEELQSAGDKAVRFDALMNKYSEDGRDESGALYAPEGYTYIYPGQMVTEFEQAALALAEGELSGIVESSYGYHIILRVPVDRETAKEDCDSDYKLSLLTQQWLDEAQVKTTKAYDELDPKNFYDRLQQVTEAREAARATPAPSESDAGGEEDPAGADAPQESAVG